MPRLSAETKAKIKEAAHHPIVWWRGADLPEEKIRPWEGGIQFFAESLKGFMSGYTGMRERIFLGMGEGKIPPNWKSVHDVTKITWDGLNDPMIGTFMDRRRFGPTIHRWIMRFNATFSPFFILLQCFDFGLTPLQRIVMWTGISMFADIMSTANAVSESKIWAGITPHTDQRAIVQLCKTVGNQMANLFNGIPMLLTGLRFVIGLSDYQIMIFGALAFAPFTIFCRWLPSFAKQRVDFSVKVKGEEEDEDAAERRLTFRESFAIVKHNRWFMMNTVVNLLRVLLPKNDEMFLYRFLLPNMKFRGKEYGGEMLWVFKNAVFGLPSVLLQPFAIHFVGKFGDKLNFIRLHVFMIFATTLAKYIVGYRTWPRLFFMFFMDLVREIFDRWAPIPKGQLDYEMLDYVEWKTGQRSEGMTMAVDGMLNKLIRNNVSSVIGNAVTQWTGYQGWDVPVEQQPERFLKSIWPLQHIGKIAGEAISLAALFWFKYPHNPREVEADLIERRELAKKLKEEAEGLHG